MVDFDIECPGGVDVDVITQYCDGFFRLDIEHYALRLIIGFINGQAGLEYLCTFLFFLFVDTGRLTNNLCQGWGWRGLLWQRGRDFSRFQGRRQWPRGWFWWRNIEAISVYV